MKVERIRMKKTVKKNEKIWSKSGGARRKRVQVWRRKEKKKERTGIFTPKIRKKNGAERIFSVSIDGMKKEAIYTLNTKRKRGYHQHQQQRGSRHKKPTNRSRMLLLHGNELEECITSSSGEYYTK